jgi:putative transposase
VRLRRRLRQTERVRAMCKALKVSASGYYDWLPPSARMLANLVLTEAICKVHNDSDETYGMPRVRAELREGGHIVSRKRVASLMRKACIRGVSRRRGFTVPSCYTVRLKTA